jgi:hypothetical protein
MSKNEILGKLKDWCRFEDWDLDNKEPIFEGESLTIWMERV